MTHLTFTNNGKTYRQISKKTAEKLYCEGKTIIICPANIHPFNQWGYYFNMNKERDKAFILDDIGAHNRFKEYCEGIEFYNCDSKTGRYLRFYAEF